MNRGRREIEGDGTVKDTARIATCPPISAALKRAAPAASLLLIAALALPGSSALAATATLRPNGAGDSTQWTASAGTNWSCVTYNDGDTRYVYTSTYLNADQYAMEDLSAAGTISAVRAYFQARRSGTFSTTNLRYGINSGGTEATSTSNLTGSYVLYGGAANFCEWTRDPATGSAWTLSGVNALQTLVRHNQNNARQERVTEVYLEVDFTTPTPTRSPTPPPTATPSPSATPSPLPSPTRPVLTFLSAADSYVNQNQANSNYGTATTMTVRSDSGGYPDTNHRSFVRFDASSIPSGATIQTATARLYLATAPTASRTYNIHRVTASWIESGAGSITWNNAPSVAGSATDAIATGTTSGVWLEWDVTADVQGFVSGTYDNYGWRVRDQTESSGTARQSTFRTREYTGTTYDPQLVVVYILPTPTPSATPTASPSPTATPSPTPTATATPGGYKTPSPSPTATATPPGYKTPSPTPTASCTPSPTCSITPMPALTATPTPWQIFGIPSGYSEFLIPGSEEQMWSVYTNNQITNMSQQSGMHAVISVVANLDDTVVYYDHWENGYGFNPQSASSTADAVYYLSQGQVQIFESSRIPVFSRGTGIYWDGMDRIYTAGGPATVTRMSWPQSVGTRYADACEVYPLKVFKNEWTMPIGENLAAAPTSYDDFTQTYVMVQSTMDGNRVEINDPWTAGTEVSVTLNKGRVTQLMNANSGTFVAASAPVQVQMLVGDNWAPNQAWESRWYTAVPDQLWDKEYYCPVGGFRKVDTYDDTYQIATNIFVHNFYDFPISISFQDQSGTGSFTVFSHTTMSYRDGAGRTVPVDSGVYLSSNYKFWGVGVGDTQYMGWDWGFSLVPGYALSREYILGWARGTSDFNPQANGNPIWITPTNDETTVYVDFSPLDGVVDRTYTLNRLQSQKVFDPDNDNTGMHVWSTDPIAVCWGEDADTAGRSDPFLDLGYSCVPVFVDWLDPVLLIEKSALPPGVPFGIGESAWFAMTVYTNDYSVDNVVVWDWMPYGWNYVTGSTRITFPDWTTSTEDPLWDSSTDPETLYWGLEKDMGPHEAMTFYFQAQTDEHIIEGLHRNETKARGTRDMGIQFFSPIAYAYVSNFAYTIDKTTETRFVEQSDYARWTIRLNNGKGGTKTNVRLTDTLPAGFTFFSDAVTWNNATRVSFAEPTVGARSLLWGTWTVYTGGDINITLDTWVASTAAPGNYLNTVFATSTESPRIKDSDTITVSAANGNCFDVAHTALTSAQTTSTSLTSAGLSASADLPAPGSIAVFCSFASETVAGSATGYWDLQMDGSYSSQTVSRYLAPSGRGLGSCINVFPSLGAGTHTVRLRHATSSSGNAVRTRQADLVVLPLTSEDGQVVLNYGKGTIGTSGASTTSNSLTNVTGLNTSVTNDVRGKIFVAATMSGESADALAKTGTWDLVMDGVPIGVPVRRYLSGTNDQGLVTLVGLSGVLSAGSHSAAVRHATSAGTLETSNGTILAISLTDDGSGDDTAIGSSQTLFSGQAGTTFTTLTAAAWSANTMYVGDGDQIIAAASFTSEHGSGAGARTASYDITVWSDETSVTETGTVQLSGTDDLTSGAIFGISDPLDVGIHTSYLRQATSSSSAEVLTGEAALVLLGVCCENTPTGIAIKDFSATGYDSQVLALWETGAETEMLGFYVQRSDEADGVYRRLNSRIILARGGASGGRYLLLDYDVENGRTYFYRLESISQAGESDFIGPVPATPLASEGSPSYPAEDFLTIEANFPAAPTPQATPSPPSPTSYPPSPTPHPPSSGLDSGDYDGNGVSDIAVYRPASGFWSVRNLTRFYFGSSEDIPASADYDGDGTADDANLRMIRRFWAVRNITRIYFGESGDLPVPGDYSGNGTAEPGVFRPVTGLWSIRNVTRFYFGSSGDLPVPGVYWSPSERKYPAVYRPASGLWSVRDLTRFYFGGSDDLPVPGNYDFAACWDGAVFRPSTGLWSIRDITRVYFGSSSDIPVPARYTGMLVDEMGVFRPSTGLWSVRNLTRLYFGSSGDMPATR